MKSDFEVLLWIATTGERGRPVLTRNGVDHCAIRRLSSRFPGTEGLKPEFRIEITQDAPSADMHLPLIR